MKSLSHNEFDIDKFYSSKIELLRKVYKKYGFAIEGEGGDETTYKVACDLVKNKGLSDEEALEFLSIYNYGCDPQWSEEELKDKIRNAQLYGRGSKSKETAREKKKLEVLCMKELIESNENNINWLVDGLLVRPSVSLMCSKPKDGKSTLVRQLALAVAKGEDFLGRSVKKGNVIYVAMEDNFVAVKNHFLGLGADENTNIYTCRGIIGTDLIALLEEPVKKIKPVLVIIDTIGRGLKFKDGNNYDQVIDVMEKVQDFAEKQNIHILGTHHNGKSDRGTGDNVLGSTAHFGCAETLISLSRDSKGNRVIQTEQRYGEPMERTKLVFDKDTKRSFLGEIVKTNYAENIQKQIRAQLTKEGTLSKTEIQEKVTGKATSINNALKEMVNNLEIEIGGSGKKNDPHKYRLVASQENNSDSLSIEENGE